MPDKQIKTLLTREEAEIQISLYNDSLNKVNLPENYKRFCMGQLAHLQIALREGNVAAEQTRTNNYEKELATWAQQIIDEGTMMRCGRYGEDATLWSNPIAFEIGKRHNGVWFTLKTGHKVYKKYQ